MRDLSKMTDTVSKAVVGYERIQEVLEIESKVRDLPRAKKAPRFKGKIEFDHVSFSYDGENPVLKDISFTIEPGQIAALVGPSGTGKTTVISLIPRFYDHHLRQSEDRWQGCARIQTEVPAGTNQFRAAGHAAVPRHHLGKHRLWQAGGLAKRDRRRRAVGQRPRVHRKNAGRLRHHGRRTRRVRCQAGNGSASPSPAQLFATRLS